MKSSRHEVTALHSEHKGRFLAGCILVSLGILLAGGGGSWDITNHLLNKPETFFSPPHAVLYFGAAAALTGAVIMYLSRHSIPNTLPIKLVITGVAMLLAAGPVDFAWHSAFGLDGLLSPPHFVLVMGMIISSVAAMLGLFYSNLKFHTIVIGLLPVWLATSGLVHMFSLPFSETPYFNFNPDPTFAVIFATIAFPLLTSFILYCSSELAKRKFGVLSITGAAFLAISAMTSIVPNEFLISTIPFYVMNIIPIVAADAALSFLPARISMYIAGAILGSAFFMIYFPLITHTYNEFFSEEPVWPSLTVAKHFGMVSTVYPVVAAPAVAAGIAGAFAGFRLIKEQNSRILR